jgi:hypothetical protein
VKVEAKHSNHVERQSLIADGTFARLQFSWVGCPREGMLKPAVLLRPTDFDMNEVIT